MCEWRWRSVYYILLTHSTIDGVISISLAVANVVINIGGKTLSHFFSQLGTESKALHILLGKGSTTEIHP